MQLALYAHKCKLTNLLLCIVNRSVISVSWQPPQRVHVKVAVFFIFFFWLHQVTMAQSASWTGVRNCEEFGNEQAWPNQYRSFPPYIITNNYIRCPFFRSFSYTIGDKKFILTLIVRPCLSILYVAQSISIYGHECYVRKNYWRRKSGPKQKARMPKGNK